MGSGKQPNMQLAQRGARQWSSRLSRATRQARLDFTVGWGKPRELRENDDGARHACKLLVISYTVQLVGDDCSVILNY